MVHKPLGQGGVHLYQLHLLLEQGQKRHRIERLLTTLLPYLVYGCLEEVSVADSR